jgi:hypothetical protein
MEIGMDATILAIATVMAGAMIVALLNRSFTGEE